MLDCCTSDTIFMRPSCLQPAAVQICPYVLNGALLLEHNVAYYLECCSESVGAIDMDHCLCNAPLMLQQCLLRVKIGSIKCVEFAHESTKMVCRICKLPAQSCQFFAQNSDNPSYFCHNMLVLFCIFHFYSASALLAVQSAVLAKGILSVCLSVCRHVPVLCPDE